MTEAHIFTMIMVLFGSLLTFFATNFWRNKDAKEKQTVFISAQQEHLKERVLELEKRLATIGQEVIPISAAFQAILINELTHLHFPETDDLLKKLGPPNVLTNEEKIQLASDMIKRSIDFSPYVTSSERDAASMLLFVAKRTEREVATLKNLIAQFKFVSVPLPIIEPELEGT